MRIWQSIGRDDGQVIVVLTGAMLTLILTVGLVFDVGIILEDRRQLQNAVDAAALAGAVAERDSPSQTVAQVETYLLANGFDVSDTALTVAVDHNYGPDQVEVTATLQVPTSFFRLINVNSKTVQVRAVGEAQIGVGVADYAIVSLNETVCDAFRKGGNSDLVINGGGGIMVNSSCASGGRAHGNGGIDADRVDHYAAGGFVVQGAASVSPAPTSRSTRAVDPLAGLPAPSMATTSPDSGGTSGSPSTATYSSSRTLHPGVYWGGLHLSGNATFTMEPGVYIMAGGGFTSAGNGAIEGDEVMIHLTSHPTPGDCGFVSLTGGKDLELTPPTSGDYEHITLWQDEDCTDDIGYRGGHDATVGVIYAPGAQVNITGGGDLGSVQLIADTVYVSGNSDYSVDFTGYVGSSGSGGVSLAE